MVATNEERSEWVGTRSIHTGARADVRRNARDMSSSSIRPRWIAATFVVALLMPALGDEPADLGVGDPYPFSRCVIVDTELDKKTELIMHHGREIRVCCPECVDQFFEDSFQWTDKIDQLIVEQQLPHYPLMRCVVDDEPLGGLGSFNYAFRNRLFRLCSGKCRQKLEKEPAKFFGKLDFAVIEKQKPNYPLTKCVVSGKPLGDDSYDHVAANLLIRLADSDQIERFNQTPGKYLATLREAVKKRAKDGGRSNEKD